MLNCLMSDIYSDCPPLAPCQAQNPTSLTGPSGFAGGSVKETMLLRRLPLNFESLSHFIRLAEIFCSFFSLLSLLSLCFNTHYVNIQYAKGNTCTVIRSKTKSAYVTVTLIDAGFAENMVKYG